MVRRALPWLLPPALLALALGGTGPATAAPACPKADPRQPTFQRRSQMERCEGLRTTRPIAATGLTLTSYTIGQPQPRSGGGGGEEFVLQVPPPPAGLPAPEVVVQARRGNYLMEPIRLQPAAGGWLRFAWGVAVVRRAGIGPAQLRATALLSPPGDNEQLLPVKFATDGAYTLVVASNGSVPVAYVRIVDTDNNTVKECSGRHRIDAELRCSWGSPALQGGTYRLVARSQNGETLLNTFLRHDPRWLGR